MTKLGLDMAYPPTIPQAQQMSTLGYTACGVYTGGPRAMAHNAWHQIDGDRYPVRDLVPYFTDGFVPICVGRNTPWDSGAMFTFRQGVADGNQANSDTGACGFDSDSLLVLDVEYGTYETYGLRVVTYITGFVSVANAVGHKVYVYGDEVLCNYLYPHRQFVDGVWGADQNWFPGADASAPVGRFDPLLPPPWDAWQFGNGIVAGVSCDFDSYVDDFPFAKYALPMAQAVQTVAA